MADPSVSPSIAESLDAAIASFFASHNPFTYVLLGIITIILVYPLFTASDPDIHPFLLARQSSAAPIRNLNESPLYRALDIPHGYPLRSALGVKDIGAPKWTSGRRGDLRDVLARAVSGPLNADATAYDASKVGKVWTLKGKETAIPTEMKEVMRVVNAVGTFTRGRVATDGKVAVCLSNSVELLACIFAAAFYDFSVTLIPYGLPQELTDHLLGEIDVHVLIAEAGTLNLDTALPSCKSLKQVILVAKPDSTHMDWASTPTPKGVSVTTWNDLTTDSDATSEIPIIDHKDGSKPKPLGTFQINVSGEMELSELTSDNLVSGISALLTTLPRTHPLSSTDTLLPTTPLTHPYTLTYILAGLYSSSSIALNSVSGPAVDLFATTAAFKPTILITSPGTLSKFLINYSRTGLGPSRFSKFFQRRSLRQGIMPSRKPVPDLNSKDAMFLVMELAALSKIRAVFVGQDVAADVTPIGPAQPTTEGVAAAGSKKPSPKLTSKDLDDLRIDLGVKIGYALTSGKVAGAVAQTNLADYRDKGNVVCVGPPVGSVEVKLRAESDGAVDGTWKRPVGKLVVKGPAVVGDSGEVELDIVTKVDTDNTLVLV